MGLAIMSLPVSERELKALRALGQVYADDGNFLSFRGIAQRSNLDKSHVRRAVRALARKGFAEYAKGLWSDDGEMRGAGYCCTHDGMTLLQYVGETE
jgi:predicted transcriptional regulator